MKKLLGKDVSLFGFDDQEVSRNLVSPLTILKPEPNGVGKLDVEILMEFMTGVNVGKFHEIQEVDLIFPETSCSLP